VLSGWDDFPVHQVAEPIRHVGTSDRNFYDRYYFNAHACSDELFAVAGMGVYPNLGTQDAFLCVRRGGTHHVVRASRRLGDRMDTRVGPFHIEVVEPLRRLRFVLEAGDYPLAAELEWRGTIPAYLEPRQHIRRHGRVLFDTVRFAQTGRWRGRLTVGSEDFAVTPDRWWGTRDRSWGVRPVGEEEPAGIRAGTPQLVGIWNYAPIDFGDSALLYMCQEEPDGTRTLEEAVRIWPDPDRAPQHLGRAEFEHRLDPGTRMITTPSRLRFPDAPGGPLEVRVVPLVHAYVAVGTGYGVGDDFRHGAWRGDLVVEHRSWPMAELDTWAWYGIVDHVARFEADDGRVGYGLHEHGIFGPYPRYGLHSGTDVAPGSAPGG
jgi:hypothetical protein